jgi:hypothetical protein
VLNRKYYVAPVCSVSQLSESAGAQDGGTACVRLVHWMTLRCWGQVRSPLLIHPAHYLLQPALVGLKQKSNSRESQQEQE